jgi:hypothetical protein
MNEEQSGRFQTHTDEFIETSVDEEMDDLVESSDGYPESAEELGENEADIRESADREESMEWFELERAEKLSAAEDRQTPLFRSEDLNQLRERWNSIQATFVDEPRSSVEQADVLVAEVMERIVGMFSEKRSLLDEQWANQEDASTEDLRVALQRYRSFFNRLLSL